MCIGIFHRPLNERLSVNGGRMKDDEWEEGGPHSLSGSESSCQSACAVQ